jgi:hypothetical protein
VTSGLEEGSPVPFCVGEEAQACAGAELLRGLAEAAVKSAELLPVSVQPSPFRTAAVLVDAAGAGAVSEQFAVEP